MGNLSGIYVGVVVHPRMISWKQFDCIPGISAAMGQVSRLDHFLPHLSFLFGYSCHYVFPCFSCRCWERIGLEPFFVVLVEVCRIWTQARDVICSTASWDVSFWRSTYSLYEVRVLFRWCLQLANIGIEVRREIVQLAFLKFNRLRYGIFFGMTAALIWRQRGQCWVCGIGSSILFTQPSAITALPKIRSGLEPLFQHPLLKEAGSLGSWTRRRLLFSAHHSTLSPSALVLL